MDILADPGGTLTIDQVASPDFATRFVSSQANGLSYGFTNTVYWVRYRIRNEAPEIRRWLVEVDFPNMFFVDLYYPASTEGQGFVTKQAGVMRPVSWRDLKFYRMVFDLPLEYQKDTLVYMRFQNGAFMFLGATLWSPDQFFSMRVVEALLFGIFYGTLLIMLVYNLFLFYSLRDWSYAFLTLFIGSGLLAQATYDGMLETYLWPAANVLKNFTLGWSIYAQMIFLLLFTISFFDLRRRMPLLRNLLFLFIGAYLVLSVLVPFITYHTGAILANYLSITTYIVVILTTLIFLIRRYKPSRYFLLSCFGFFFGDVMIYLSHLGVITNSFLLEQSSRIALTWLVAFFALALADRIQLLKAETDDANRELQHSRNRLNQILDGLPVGVIEYGQERRPTYTNRQFNEMLKNQERGIQPDPSARRTMAESRDYFSLQIAGTNQAYPVERLPILQAFEGKPASVDDIEADLIDRRVSLEVWASPVRDEQGQVESVVSTVMDITQRRQVEAELEEHRQNLEQLVAKRTDELISINSVLQTEITERERLQADLDLRIKWLTAVNLVNQGEILRTDMPHVYEKLIVIINDMFGAEDTFIAEPHQDKAKIGLPPDKEVQQEFTILTHSINEKTDMDWKGADFSIPSSILPMNSLPQWKHIILSPDQLGTLGGQLSTTMQAAENQILVLAPIQIQERLVGILGLEFINIEHRLPEVLSAFLERICFDIALLEDRSRMAEQSRALVAADERSRLARDLHDSVTQVLFAANLIAEVLPQVWRRNPEKGLKNLEELRHLMRGALAEMRTMLLELRPSGVIKTPLGELLVQLTEAVTSRSGLTFQLFIEHLPALPEDVHIGFYRIAQEALNNVIKHANAKQVSVSLSATPMTPEINGTWNGEVILVIRDDGDGFVIQKEKTKRMGLSIMNERAIAIHATLSVESQLGKGTTVRLSWLTKAE